ncbi:unnamed protein product [Trifolium pratense]|uniref:Uncharacterized protein n=1 Tax=Trifolium pratense TaxID=57577 RepID=A0ACB0IKX7_TRIPR|nr:unnamed protein product [Trifolium pratense]
MVEYSFSLGLIYQKAQRNVVRTRGGDGRIRHNRGRGESRPHQEEPEDDEMPPVHQEQVEEQVEEEAEQQAVQQAWPGGPIDTSLLTRYEHHVAHDAPADDAPQETALQRERRWRGMARGALETFLTRIDADRDDEDFEELFFALDVCRGAYP